MDVTLETINEQANALLGGIATTVRRFRVPLVIALIAAVFNTDDVLRIGDTQQNMYIKKAFETVFEGEHVIRIPERGLKKASGLTEISHVLETKPSIGEGVLAHYLEAFKDDKYSTAIEIQDDVFGPVKLRMSPCNEGIAEEFFKSYDGKPLKWAKESFIYVIIDIAKVQDEPMRGMFALTQQTYDSKEFNDGNWYLFTRQDSLSNFDEKYRCTSFKGATGSLKVYFPDANDTDKAFLELKKQSESGVPGYLLGAVDSFISFRWIVFFAALYATCILVSAFRQVRLLYRLRDIYVRKIPMACLDYQAAQYKGKSLYAQAVGCVTGMAGILPFSLILNVPFLGSIVTIWQFALASTVEDPGSYQLFGANAFELVILAAIIMMVFSVTLSLCIANMIGAIRLADRYNKATKVDDIEAFIKEAQAAAQSTPDDVDVEISRTNHTELTATREN